MCILCNDDTLDLLTTPLDRLAPGRLADAVRAAREAAGPGAMDHIEAVLRGEAPAETGVGLYGEIVVARALESGVLTHEEAYHWEERFRIATGTLDPRIQAFVSSCAEILDDYRAMVDERRRVVQRFVEAGTERVHFAGLGRDGEIWLEYRGEFYAVLTRDESMEVVERELAAMLHTIEPAVLLPYTRLPDGSEDVIAEIQTRAPEDAAGILAGMVDLALLADDRVAAVGYAPFFQGEPPRPTEALQFGDWVIIRVPVQPES